MKTHFITFMLIVFSIVSITNAQEKFVLEAEISGLDDNTRLIINPYLPNMNVNMDDETVIYPKNGKFRLEGNYPVPTKICIRFRPENTENLQESEETYFWAENKQMTLKGEKGSLAFANITGSVLQDEYEEMISTGKNLTEETKIVQNALMTNNFTGKSRESLVKQYNDNMFSIERKQIEFALNHPDYLCCEAKLVFNINYLPEMLDKSEMTIFYNKLSNEFKNNVYGKQIKEFISNEEMLYPLLGIGDLPYQFVLNDISDNAITLAELEGNYVLLDFWGSGCGPCRAEHKNYLENYKKYSSKGFEILSVSQDQSKRLWKNAMEKDNMIWKSVWDNDRSITKMYRINYIPANFLIDREGKIIAKDIRGEELSNTMAELFEN